MGRAEGALRALIPLALWLLAAPAAARGEALVVDPAVDIPLTLAPAPVWFAISALKVDAKDLDDFPLPPRPTRLDALSPFDDEHRGAWLLSNGLLIGALGGGLAVDVWDGARDGDASGRALLYLEALSWVSVSTELVKAAVERPRPYTYATGVEEVEDLKSFFSGHTSFTAAAAFTTARSLDLTADLSPGARWALYGGAGALTAATGAARVVAGKHYVSDVVTGAIVGACVGWLVPELHRGDRAVGLAPWGGFGDGRAGGLMASGAF